MITKYPWLAFIFCTVQLCDAYKILVVFPMPSKSHGILGDGIVKHLLEAGHELTYVTPFPRKAPPPRLHEIDVSKNVDHLPDTMSNIASLLNNETTVNTVSLTKFIATLSAKTIENPNFVNILSDANQQFDVVIAEWLHTDIFTGLGPVFGCPFIWVSTTDPHWMVLQLVDETPNPAYVPDMLSNNLPPFTFLERIQELYLMMMGTILKNAIYDSEKNVYEKLIEPYIIQRGKVAPTFDEVRYNASLILGNSHVSIGLASKLPQNYKAIAGYHIDKAIKPLPNDLNTILENAKNGVIYFSLGSNLKSKDLPNVLKEGLLKMFSELKQTVIWKFEEVLPGLPKNVYIVNWAPQQSILAHPNCILFITHGGLLSIIETIHFGKPIVGIPALDDHFNNIDRAVKKGYALRVDLSYNMVDDLKKALKEMLNNPKYTDVAKQLSAIYHDRPVSPGTELVHWVEHVVRTRGAPHLRSPALDIPFYQKMYLDLAALILATIFILKIAIMYPSSFFAI